jgi:hypothetical protein
VKRLASTLASAAVLLGLLAASRPAHAQGTGGTTGTTIGSLSAADFAITIQDEKKVNLSLYDQARFFDKANCDCDKKVNIYVSLTASGIAKRPTIPNTGTVKLFIGAGDCTNTTVQATGQCLQLASQDLGTFLSQRFATVPTTARVLSQNLAPGSGPDGGATSGDPCSPTNIRFEQTIFLIVDINSNGTVDVVPAPTKALTVDTQPPPAPTGVSVSPGNEAVVVKWTPLDFATNMDLAGYQILCRRAADLPVFAPGTFTPYLQTCAQGTSLEALDTRYVCSPLLTRSTSSFRVKILQNDIVYGASVVAVDNSGNASAPDVFEAIPEKTLSFYDYYRSPEVGGDAQGGFCAVAPAKDRDPRPLAGGAVAAAAVAGLVLRARRRGRKS